MQGILKFTFLGMDEFVGKKDPTKKFYNVSLLQNSEIAKVFLETGQEELFRPLEKFDEIVAVVSWRIGQDKYGVKLDYRIISFRPMIETLPDHIEDLPENNEYLSENITDITSKGKESKITPSKAS